MDSSIEKDPAASAPTPPAAEEKAAEETAPPATEARDPHPVKAATHAVRGMRAMAVVRWALLVAVSLVALYNVVTIWGPSTSTHADARPDHYYCSMHPQIRSADPGQCPICHMDLVPIPEERKQGPSTPDPAGSPSPAGALAPAAAPADPAAQTAPPGLQTVTLALDRQQLFGITVTPVTSVPLANRLRVPASVETPRSGVAEVRVRAPGFIESVAVRETGIRVKKGQALASMFSPDIYRAQEELLAAHKWSEGPAAAAAGGTATDMLAAARRGLELLGISKAEIDAAIRSGHASRNVTIRAPISGVVTKFYGVLGMRAMPEAPLYEIADLSKVWIVASVQERDLPHVQPGMVAEFAPSNRPADVRKARVDLIEPDVSPTTRTIRVRFTADNKDYDLRPGQYGEVAFDLPEEKALSVPRDAVIDIGKVQYVFVASEGGRFEPRVVRVGTLVGDRLQILSGLKEGESVVTRGGFLVDSESRLRASLEIVPSPAASAR